MRRVMSRAQKKTSMLFGVCQDAAAFSGQFCTFSGTTFAPCLPNHGQRKSHQIGSSLRPRCVRDFFEQMQNSHICRGANTSIILSEPGQILQACPSRVAIGPRVVPGHGAASRAATLALRSPRTSRRAGAIRNSPTPDGPYLLARFNFARLSVDICGVRFGLPGSMIQRLLRQS
jgi:hypothetical protein